MTHAPKFWADKLPADMRAEFWSLVNDYGFSGETAYHRVKAGTYRNPRRRKLSASEARGVFAQAERGTDQAYKGYRIYFNALRDEWYVSKGGAHIGTFSRVSDAKAAIDLIADVPQRNPARVTKRAKRAARSLVSRYGSKRRAREVAGGMIGTATTRKQREHFVRVRKSLDVNPRQQKFTVAQIEALRREYGRLDRIEPDSASYKQLTAKLDVMPQVLLQQLAAARIPFVSALARNRVTWQKMARKNPKHRMPLTPEDYGILRAMTKEHGKRAVSRAALRANPVPMFPMYVRKGSGKWSMVAVFNKLDNARTVGNLIRLRGYQVRVTDGKD
jgi:hypothetical protein